jgi:Spy/CpxP family protein refolding chaperone
MKRFFTVAILMWVAFYSYGQQAKGSLVASVSEVDRRNIIKSSIDVPSWHERSFWPLYENYMTRAEEASSEAYRTLGTLAKTDKKVSGPDALDNARQMLASRKILHDIRKQSYVEIANALNGIIAMQFLQTETLLDMMESSRVYDATSWKKFRFHPKALTTHQFKAAKNNTITKALELTEEEADKFWPLYSQYEEECDALLGEDYSVIALYAGDAPDFTPALAKRLGNEFLQIMDRELKLKEKYFQKMNEKAGPSVASRFLAWEDYYSLVSKMHAWAEMP